MTSKTLYSLLIFRGCFVLAILVTTTLSLIDLNDLPIPSIWDKLEHASAFLLLSFLLDQSLPRYQTRRLLHPGQMIFLLGYGLLIEVLQSYTPHREASTYDVLADATGIAAYWIIYVVRHPGKITLQRQ